MVPDGGSRSVPLGSFRTDQAGTVCGSFRVPDASGRHRLVVSARSGLAWERVECLVELRPDWEVVVTTDKPRYEPGQTVHLRVLALEAHTRRPANRRSVTVRLADPQGHGLFTRSLETSPFGIAATDCALPDRADCGVYRVCVEIDSARVAQAVDVARGPRSRVASERPVFDASGTSSARTSDSILILLAPEGGTIVSKLEQTYYVLTMYPDGRPARTRVRCEVRHGRVMRAVTDANGLATIESKSYPCRIEAEDRGGNRGRLERQFADGSGSLLLTTDRVLCRPGEAVRATLKTPKPRPVILLALSKRDQTLWTGSVEPTLARTDTTVPIPENVSGMLGLHAYFLTEKDELGVATCYLHVRPPEDLQVSIEPDNEVYSPGASARLSLRVTRPDGSPVVAALGLSAVSMPLDRAASMPASPDYRAIRCASDEPPQGLDPSICGTLAELDGLPASLRQAIFAVASARMRPRRNPRLDRRQRGRRGADLATLDRYLQARLGQPCARALTAFQGLSRRSRFPYAMQMSSYVEKTAHIERTQRLWKHAAIVALWVFGGLIVVAAPAWFVAECLVRMGKVAARGRVSSVELMHTNAALFLVCESVHLELGVPLLSLTAFWLSSALAHFGRHHASVAGSVALGLLLVWVVYRQLRRLVAMSSVWPCVGSACVLAVAAAGLVRPGRTAAAAGVAIVSSLAVIAQCFRFQVAALLALPVPLETRSALPRRWTLLVRSAGILLALLLLAADALSPVLRDLGWRAWAHRLSEIWAWLALAGVALLILTEAQFSRIANRLRHPHLSGLSRYSRWSKALMMAFLLVILLAMLLPAFQAPTGGGTLPGPGILTFARRQPILPSPCGTPRGPAVKTQAWRPQVITNERGRAEVVVPLTKGLPTQVTVSAVSQDGATGHAAASLRVRSGFVVDVDVPHCLTQGDVLTLPILVHNDRDQQAEVGVHVKCSKCLPVLEAPRRTIRVWPGGVAKTQLTVRASRPGPATIKVLVRGPRVRDVVRRDVLIEPKGRKIVATHEGALEGTVEHRVAFPAHAIPGSTALAVSVHPTLLNPTLEYLDGPFSAYGGKAYDALLGAYGNAVYLRYLRRSGQTRPDVEMKLQRAIAKGYRWMLAHAALSSGLRHFTRSRYDLSRIGRMISALNAVSEFHPIDLSLIPRGSKWLLDQQQPDGSWPRRDATTAEVTWSLLMSGSTAGGVSRAVDLLHQRLGSLTDPYELALVANVLVAADAQSDNAEQALDRLLAGRRQEGRHVYWPNPRRGCWPNTTSETTELAALALLKANRAVETARRALLWLTEHNGGRFWAGPARATMLMLRAMEAGLDWRWPHETVATVEISLDGRPVHRFHIDHRSADCMQSAPLRLSGTRSEHVVRLVGPTDAVTSYQVLATHYEPWSASPTVGDGTLRVEMGYDRTELFVDETVRCNVRVTRLAEEGAEMVMVEVGVPAGLEPVTPDLEALTQREVIAAYFVSERCTTLYVRRIEPNEPFTASFRLSPRYPVRALGPPTVAYEFACPSNRTVAAPPAVVVSKRPLR